MKQASCKRTKIEISLLSPGGRNHRVCCSNNGLAPSCLKFCSGQQMDTQPSDFVCLPQAAIMTRCFDAGVRSVPSRPRQFSARAVTFKSITWSWEPPTNLGDSESPMKYRLLYQNVSAAAGKESLTWDSFLRTVFFEEVSEAPKIKYHQLRDFSSLFTCHRQGT